MHPEQLLNSSTDFVTVSKLISENPYEYHCTDNLCLITVFSTFSFFEICVSQSNIGKYLVTPCTFLFEINLVSTGWMAERMTNLSFFSIIMQYFTLLIWISLWLFHIFVNVMDSYSLSKTAVFFNKSFLILLVFKATPAFSPYFSLSLYFIKASAFLISFLQT